MFHKVGRWFPPFPRATRLPIKIAFLANLLYIQSLMDGYPFNLILAVVTPTTTILLGFLPTKTIHSSFFAREALVACFAWLLIATLLPHGIVHYALFFAMLCGGAWWKFRADNSFSGKMWLSIASGLGISVGVMLILAITPRANPAGLLPTTETLLLASIYLGGALIGLAYFCYVLSQSISLKTGVTLSLLQRYTGLLFVLTLARAGLSVFQFLAQGHMNLSPLAANPFLENYGNQLELLLLVLTILLLPLLAYLAQRATRLQSRNLPTYPLIAFLLLATIAEVLARLLVL